MKNDLFVPEKSVEGKSCTYLLNTTRARHITCHMPWSILLIISIVHDDEQLIYEHLRDDERSIVFLISQEDSASDISSDFDLLFAFLTS